ncbi:hypothetical protein M0813_12305 [Anaeramoeba flamelloides]|uniref:Uncharacterized protein n=1 Tax=Anaeramoeba flamelloides TaxID=1746091 RepID=A0ABQ8ZCV6_9EUKA|nr:hypothetical protein M0813_12305 [Anaeramoeba flamelloides]
MSVSTILSEDLQNHPNLESIKRYFRTTKSYIDRFHKLRKLRSHCFVGLLESHLTKEWIQDNKSKVMPDAPQKIKIKKDCISDLSFLTQRSRRTIERGVSAFFKKNFKLTNCSFYSRDWLIFKIPSPMDEKRFQTRQRRNKSPSTSKEKRSEKGTYGNVTKPKSKNYKINKNLETKGTAQRKIMNKTKPTHDKNIQEMEKQPNTKSIQNDQRKIHNWDLKENFMNRKRKSFDHNFPKNSQKNLTESTVSQKKQLKKTNDWNYGILKIDLFPSVTICQNNWLYHFENEFGLKC